MKKRNLYVFIGATPKDWSETNALGPFTSEAKARAAIRENLNEALEGCETLSPGVDDDWAEQYHIMEMVKSFSPVVTAKVSVSLPVSKKNPLHLDAVSLPVRNEYCRGTGAFPGKFLEGNDSTQTS